MKDHSAPFPIVGIGASAGGLAAFEAFFAGLPAGRPTGMAFVLVQHLAPDHQSILADLIRRYTRLPVLEVTDGMAVEPDCVYVIPPNRDLAFLDGALRLTEPVSPRGQRLTIDFFFRSLALDQHERAICIVLSGTGSDGTHGLRAVKAEGGMAMAQAPGSTEYDGMPASAIATGVVDYVLPPEQMGVQLLAYVAHAFGSAEPRPPLPAPRSESTLLKVAALLRAKTGHDFSQYKPNTLQRRIERRLSVHQLGSLAEYVAFLEHTPEELDALFRDLLIGVTNFFRDREAFRILEEHIIPELFAAKPSGAEVRVWSAGCSTGEEAYSLAILLQERLEALRQNHRVQVFATDIDPQAIVAARAGVFPASIAADLTPERLARFFTPEPDGNGFRIHKLIRDLVVFSEQDLIKDPPFSRLDLISCRNVLIYMGGELQKKLIPLFHYALNPGGFLFQGNSESVGEFSNLFAVLDRKAKVYRRKDDGKRPLGRSTPWSSAPGLASLPAPKPLPGRMPLRALTEEALLQEVVQACALVNGQGDILYLHGRTGLFLEPAEGEAGVNNILSMAREGLGRELTTALHHAVGTQERVHLPGLWVKTNGDFTAVDLTVRPIMASEPVDGPLYLVILEPGADHTKHAHAPRTKAKEIPAEMAALQRELAAKEAFLKASNEELETSNEELKSSNEEMQSVNEELQSTNEELETSKEELQSVNEELATVNAELQAKVADLSRANNDMNNLLAGTGIGTVFVDTRLCILRFTPAAAAIINLIPGDVGRPVAHVVSNLVGYDTLVQDVRSVLDTLIPLEREVRTLDGRWYAMRLNLYRTLDNVIEGAVLTFVDISETKRIQALLEVGGRP